MPDGSLLKFVRDARPGVDHGGGNLLWPGTANGFPVRVEGPAPNLKQAEFDELRHVLDFHSEQFDLWKPDHKQRFDTVRDYIANGLFMQSLRINTEKPEGLSVWLEWVQVYGEVPTGKQPGANDGPITLKPARTPDPVVARTDAPRLGEVSGEPLGGFDENCWRSLTG